MYQGFQEMMNTINLGMEHRSKQHDSLHKLCETEFEKIYKQFRNPIVCWLVRALCA